jgi:hypothetical protein
MEMRNYIDLVEAIIAPPSTDTPADRFIQAAHEALANTHGGEVPVQFKKTSPRSVAVMDRMNGVRGQREWAIIRALTAMAAKHDIRVNVSGGAGRFPWR